MKCCGYTDFSGERPAQCNRIATFKFIHVTGLRVDYYKCDTHAKPALELGQADYEYSILGFTGEGARNAT